MQIPTYIINLKERTDRLENVLNNFKHKKEFDVTVVEGLKFELGTYGLWETIRHILKDLTRDTDDFILICEDDHEFTAAYSAEKLLQSITRAQEMGADILCGGISWVNHILEAKDGLLWMERFSGLQFTIIFRKCFGRILSAPFMSYDAADLKISDLAEGKYFIHPFISIQKDYGYSDVTQHNNVSGRVSMLFERSHQTVNMARKIIQHYKNIPVLAAKSTLLEFPQLSIQTYVINLQEREDRRMHIEQQFQGRNEFDLTIVDACKHQRGAVGLWMSIRKIIQLALDQEDDVIIICEDDHEFTYDYNKDYLLENIIEASSQGLQMLLGGITDMNMALPIADDRYWVSNFLSTQFIVLYRNVFQAILDEEFDDSVSASDKLSQIIVNKAVIFPFVSVQREFGNSGMLPSSNEHRKFKPRNEQFKDCMNRFYRIKHFHEKLGQ